MCCVFCDWLSYVYWYIVHINMCSCTCMIIHHPLYSCEEFPCFLKTFRSFTVPVFWPKRMSLWLFVKFTRPGPSLRWTRKPLDMDGWNMAKKRRFLVCEHPMLFPRVFQDALCKTIWNINHISTVLRGLGSTQFPHRWKSNLRSAHENPNEEMIKDSHLVDQLRNAEMDKGTNYCRGLPEILISWRSVASSLHLLMYLYVVRQGSRINQPTLLWGDSDDLLLSISNSMWAASIFHIHASTWKTPVHSDPRWCCKQTHAWRFYRNENHEQGWALGVAYELISLESPWFGVFPCYSHPKQLGVILQAIIFHHLFIL